MVKSRVNSEKWKNHELQFKAYLQRIRWAMQCCPQAKPNLPKSFCQYCKSCLNHDISRWITWELPMLCRAFHCEARVTQLSFFRTNGFLLAKSVQVPRSCVSLCRSHNTTKSEASRPSYFLVCYVTSVVLHSYVNWPYGNLLLQYWWLWWAGLKKTQLMQINSRNVFPISCLRWFCVVWCEFVVWEAAGTPVDMIRWA